MAPPVVEWKTILDDVNAKTRKLEEDYEGTCIERKVSQSSLSKLHLKNEFLILRKSAYPRVVSKTLLSFEFAW